MQSNDCFTILPPAGLGRKPTLTTGEDWATIDASSRFLDAIKELPPNAHHSPNNRTFTLLPLMLPAFNFAAACVPIFLSTAT